MLLFLVTSIPTVAPVLTVPPYLKVPSPSRRSASPGGSVTE